MFNQINKLILTIFNLVNCLDNLDISQTKRSQVLHKTSKLFLKVFWIYFQFNLLRALLLFVVLPFSVPVT